MCLGADGTGLKLSPELKEEVERQRSTGMAALNSGAFNPFKLLQFQKQAEEQDQRDMAISDSGGTFGLRVRTTPVSVQSFKNPLALKGD